MQNSRFLFLLFIERTSIDFIYVTQIRRLLSDPLFLQSSLFQEKCFPKREAFLTAELCVFRLAPLYLPQLPRARLLLG